MKIRKYNLKDKEEVEKIHFETGFLGKSMDKFLTRTKEWDDEIKHYFENEPESIFVAIDNNKIIGYLIGFLDDSRQNKTLEFIKTNIKNLIKSPLMHPKDRKFLISRLKFIFRVISNKSDEKICEDPKNAGHLHINFLPDARGKGIGSKLLKKFFEYAKKNGVKTIHADGFQTDLNPNKNFWIKNGFKEYSKVRTSYWQEQLPNEQIYLVCYVKEL